SRRRHTRCLSDWSSDVCSSDLKTSIVSEAVKLHFNLGNFYFRNRQYKAAAKEYEEAVYFAPEDAAAHFNLAIVSEEYLGDTETRSEERRVGKECRTRWLQ